MSLRNWEWNDVIPGYIAIGVIGIYFESTPGVKRMYSYMTPGGPRTPGGRLNKKDGLTRYGDSHVKDKTS